ncbi:glutaredoxin domain-containing protein [Nonomuraea sp. NPDC003214]
MSPLMTALLIVAALYVAWTVLANLPRRGRSASHSGADRTGVVVYWRPGCRYCMRLRTGLRFTPLAYAEVNIWRDPEAAAFVRSVNGGDETVPTVTVGGRVLVNPSRRQLLEAAGQAG